MGGKLLLKLNIGTRPIANKYREGKMKSTLKRKLKYVKPLVGKRMELAMPVRDSGVGCRVCGVRRSEGLLPCNSLLLSLHFSHRCVNECSDRVIRLAGR